MQLPLSRLSLSEIRREVFTQGLVAEISGATLWRWLSADALRPWRHRSWIFPRDPDFAAKAGRTVPAHRGQKAVDRLRSQWPNVVFVHTPRPR